VRPLSNEHEEAEPEWGSPSFYGRGERPMSPPGVAGADPISAVLVQDWVDSTSADEHAAPDSPTREDAPADEDEQWGVTRYIGGRRRRRHERAGTTAAGSATSDTAEAADTEAADTEVSTELADPQGPSPQPLPTTASESSTDRSNKGLLANSRTMAIASLASRITGFLRSSLLVAALGIHLVGDAYNLANNLPNMVYELLLGGVLSSVLIPLLVHAEEEDEDGGVGYTQRLLSIATAALGIVTLVAVAGAPLIASGFVHNASQRSLTSIFATLLLPEIFFYGLGAMFMAVLNIRHSYGPGAWSPVLNNVILIVTLVIFWLLPGPATLTPTSMTTAQVLVVGVGTTLGIAAQALVLIPPLRRSGFHWQWRFRARPNEVGRMKQASTLACWVLGYVVASQIGVTVIGVVGVAHRAFTVFTNADLLIQMPYGILVVSLLTALMPRLSRAAAREQTDSVIHDLGLGARLSAVALLPVTAGLIVLGPALGVVLFAHGETSVAGGRLIGIALAASAFGLFPFAMVMLQLRIFYAMRDGRTPTLINVFMVATKVALVLICVHTFDTPRAIGVALTTATSASYVVGAVVGHIALTRRLGRLRFGAVIATVVRLAVASVIGGLVAEAITVGIDRTLGTAHLASLVTLLVAGGGGLAAFAIVVWRMRIPEIQDMLALVRRR
jgi:putative peptidoglycan lipid II flippase